MSEQAVQPKAKKVRKLTGATVEIDLSVSASHPFCSHKGLDAWAECEVRRTERAVQEFNDFLRDHRSQSHVRVIAARTYDDVCSECGERWETMTDDDGEMCASCGATIEGGAA